MRATDLIGNGVFTIGEIGINHQGSPVYAQQLIDACADYGLSAVKGQLRDIENPPESGGSRVSWWDDRKEYAFGESYYEHRKALELPLTVHDEMRRYAAHLGLTYSVSVWDINSARRWLAESPTWIKIPSARMTDRAILSACSEADVVTIMSCGMSNLSEIRQSVAHWRDKPEQLILLYTKSAYPLENHQVRGVCLETLWREFPDIVVGASGHWKGIQIDSFLEGKGVRIFERHVTLDRTMKGSDHAASLGPAGIQKWARDLKVNLEAWGNDPQIKCEAYEQAARDKLRG